MIIKTNPHCVGKGYFLVNSGSSKSNLNQNLFSEKTECLHLSPMAGFFLVVTNGEFVSGRHQQIYPALTLLRQTVQLCKFSTSVLFSRSRLHRQHFSAQLIISTFPHHSTHELMEYRWYRGPSIQELLSWLQRMYSQTRKRLLSFVSKMIFCCYFEAVCNTKNSHIEIWDVDWPPPPDMKTSQKVHLAGYSTLDPSKDISLQ